MAWYDDVFAVRVWQRSELFGTSIALLCVGDVVLMPMSPSRDAPSAPGRFRERFGERLHSLALYVINPVELIEHLRSLGFRLTGSAGGELSDPRDEIWTQPRETPVMLEFFEPRPSMNDPRLEEGWTAAPWRHDHPMGVVSAFYTVVTPDLSSATDFFVNALHAKVRQREVTTPYGTLSTFVSLSDGVLVEVAYPSDGASEAAQDLADRATFHAVTFHVEDIARARSHLTSKGVRTTVPSTGHVALERADCFGVRFRLTDQDVTDW
jgi:catechol 2,3-dioxygenase-like lactoylglutathione lyase family enzyme